MSVVKVVELMSDSDESWEEATNKAIEKAGKTVKNIKTAWVKDQSVVVKDGKVKAFRVTLKVSFEID